MIEVSPQQGYFERLTERMEIMMDKYDSMLPERHCQIILSTLTFMNLNPTAYSIQAIAQMNRTLMLV